MSVSRKRRIALFKSTLASVPAIESSVASAALNGAEHSGTRCVDLVVISSQGASHICTVPLCGSYSAFLEHVRRASHLAPDSQCFSLVLQVSVELFELNNELYAQLLSMNLEQLAACRILNQLDPTTTTDENSMWTHHIAGLAATTSTSVGASQQQQQLPNSFYSLGPNLIQSTSSLAAAVSTGDENFAFDDDDDDDDDHDDDLDDDAILSGAEDADMSMSSGGGGGGFAALSERAQQQQRVAAQPRHAAVLSPTGLLPPGHRSQLNSPSPLAAMLSRNGGVDDVNASFTAVSELGSSVAARARQPSIKGARVPVTYLGANQMAIFFEHLSPTVLNITCATDEVADFRTCALFEHPSSRLPSSHRLLIYDNEPALSMQVAVESVSRDVQAFLRECICMSTIIVVSPYKRAAALLDDPVLLMIVEFPVGQDFFHIDGHVSTMRSVKTCAKRYMWSNMFPLARSPTSEEDEKGVLAASIGSALSPTVGGSAISPSSKLPLVPMLSQTSASPDFVTSVGTPTVNDDDSSSRRNSGGAAGGATSRANVSRAHTPDGAQEAEDETRSTSLFSSRGAASDSEQLSLNSASASATSTASERVDALTTAATHAEAMLRAQAEAEAAVLRSSLTYRPHSHRTFVLLDLDKTLFLSDADAREDQRFAFVGDFEIAGNMAITNERFAHRMMLRPGAHWFLRRVLAVAEVYVITAGDLHYARAAVRQANERNWVSSKDPTTDFEQTVAEVHIPLTRVFSVRNHAKRAAPKTLERALPFAQHMISSAGCAVLAVDDDPGAWDASCRHHVIPVSPFQPFNNSPDCLLHVAWLIEQASAQFFSTLHSRLPSTRVPIEHVCALVGVRRDGHHMVEDAHTEALPPLQLDKRIRGAVKSVNIVDVVHQLVNSL